MKISSAIEINSTPEVVLGWLEKPERAKRWMTSVSKTEILHETKDRVGTTFREIVQDDGGALEMQGVITAFVPNKSIAFHLQSKVNTVDVEYTIAKMPMGVRLLQDANVQWKFPVNIISLFIGAKIKQNVNAQTQAEFYKLKELCEQASIANSNLSQVKEDLC